MTKQELEAEANRIIVGVKYALELQNTFSPLFLLHHRGGWKPLQLPKSIADIMDSGRGKAILFDGLRSIIEKTGCDGVIISSDTWMATATEEGMKHLDSPEMKAPPQGFDEVVKRGWMTRKEAILVSAQSATDALLIQQEYQRRGNAVQLLQAKRNWVPQSQFRGRMKMFGDLCAENLS